VLPLLLLLFEMLTLFEWSDVTVVSTLVIVSTVSEVAVTVVWTTAAPAPRLAIRVRSPRCAIHYVERLFYVLFVNFVFFNAVKR